MNILIKNNKNKILNCINFDEAMNIFKKDIWGTKNRFVCFLVQNENIIIKGSLTKENKNGYYITYHENEEGIINYIKKYDNIEILWLLRNLKNTSKNLLELRKVIFTAILGSVAGSCTQYYAKELIIKSKNKKIKLNNISKSFLGHGAWVLSKWNNINDIQNDELSKSIMMGINININKYLNFWNFFNKKKFNKYLFYYTKLIKNKFKKNYTIDRKTYKNGMKLIKLKLS